MAVLYLSTAASLPRDSSHLFRDVLPWLLMLIALVLVGGVVIFLIRRSLTSGDAFASRASFTLQELRDLHASGDLTEEEFQRAKEAMIGRLAARPAAASRAQSSAPPSPPPTPPPDTSPDSQTNPPTGNH